MKYKTYSIRHWNMKSGTAAFDTEVRNDTWQLCLLNMFTA